MDSDALYLKVIKYLPIAESVASLSKDGRNKVGAIALGPVGFEIRSTGVNGLPRKVEEHHPERHEKPEKFFWYCHAEENLVANAARFGASLEGCHVLVTSIFPCSTCARMLINSGIASVTAPAPDPSTTSEKWVEESIRSTQMFNEAKVKIHFYRR